VTVASSMDARPRMTSIPLKYERSWNERFDLPFWNRGCTQLPRTRGPALVAPTSALPLSSSRGVVPLRRGAAARDRSVSAPRAVGRASVVPASWSRAAGLAMRAGSELWPAAANPKRGGLRHCAISSPLAHSAHGPARSSTGLRSRRSRAASARRPCPHRGTLARSRPEPSPSSVRCRRW
jgi:hypothetical protein